MHVLGCNLKNDRMISVRFQGKPFNITVIQVYAPTSNAEEAEVEQFYEDLESLLELTPKKCGFSSVGRASPCQGEGGGFEPRNPLHKKDRTSKRMSYLFYRTDYAVRRTRAHEVS